MKGERGGIALEATLIMPVFLSFVLALNTCIRIAVAEMALQTAVTETTKVLAANMYPVQILYTNAKQKWVQSKPAELLGRVLEQVNSVRSKVTGAEDTAEQYANYIPEPLLDLIQWEKKKRESLEQAGRDGLDDLQEKLFDPLVNQVFTPIVYHYADQKLLKKEHLQVIHVTFPDFEHKEKAFIEIEAQYNLKLSVPFLHKTLQLRKKAYERAWLGN